MFNFFWRSKTTYKLPHGKYADPLQSWRKLLQGNITTLVESHEKPNLWQKAEEDLCNLTRHVFNLPQLDLVSGWGFTDEDCLDLLWDFLSYIEKKEKRGSGLQTTVAVMAPQETSL